MLKPVLVPLYTLNNGIMLQVGVTNALDAPIKMLTTKCTKPNVQTLCQLKTATLVLMRWAKRSAV